MHRFADPNLSSNCRSHPARECPTAPNPKRIARAELSDSTTKPATIPKTTRADLRFPDTRNRPGRPLSHPDTSTLPNYSREVSRPMLLARPPVPR